jgi:hypothetical protein
VDRGWKHCIHPARGNPVSGGKDLTSQRIANGKHKATVVPYRCGRGEQRWSTPERDRLAFHQSLGDGSTDSQPREAAGSIGKHNRFNLGKTSPRAAQGFKYRGQELRRVTPSAGDFLLGNDGSGKTERNRGTISGRINRQPH